MSIPPPSWVSPKTSASPRPTLAVDVHVEAFGKEHLDAPGPGAQLDGAAVEVLRVAHVGQVEHQLAGAELVAVLHVVGRGRHPHDLVVPAAARGRAGHADRGHAVRGG